ncbi:MAG: iron-containing alcohol dehydrogenase, partial [Candidatus Brocadiia bacterium]
MNNFSYCNPVNVVFGKGSISKLAELTASHERILMLYGGGSIKKNGVYDQIKAALKGKNLVEFAGIEPNPQLETCLKAVKLAKKEKIALLLAVGGGSVLDAVKFISAAIKYEGADPWEIMTSHGSVVKSAMPFGTVLTLPATGSEMNFFSVISRKDTDEKLAFGTRVVYPQFSILDPEVTYSIPKKYLRNGLVDAFVHVMEQYATYDVDTPLQDRQAEAIVKTVVEISGKVLSGKADYNT